MTWRIRLAEREQRIAKLEREIERLQRIEDLRRVTLVTNEICACQHSSVPAGMRRPLSPTADIPSRTSVAAKCHRTNPLTRERAAREGGASGAADAVIG